MRALPLDELPKYTPWPLRLLSLQEFAPRTRTRQMIEAEYNEDKFKLALDRYKESGGKLDPVALRFSFDRASIDTELDAVWEGELVLATVREIWDRIISMLEAAVAPAISRNETIVELGCAFGYNLWCLAQKYPEATYRGGEYTETAIELAGLLYKDMPQIKVGKFDFYESSNLILEQVEGKATIFTSQAIEQLPSAAEAIAGIKRYKDKVSEVIHIEPGFLFHKTDTLLGAMRKRYGIINDYNRDLHSVLKQDPTIEVMEIRQEIVGYNAFNPLSLVRWKFR